MPLKKKNIVMRAQSFSLFIRLAISGDVVVVAIVDVPMCG